MSKKAQKKSQDKSLQSKPNKEEDTVEVQRCIERLRELLQGKFLKFHFQIVPNHVWKKRHVTIAHLVVSNVQIWCIQYFNSPRLVCVITWRFCKKRIWKNSTSYFYRSKIFTWGWNLIAFTAHVINICAIFACISTSYICIQTAVKCILKGYLTEIRGYRSTYISDIIIINWLKYSRFQKYKHKNTRCIYRNHKNFDIFNGKKEK